MDEFPDAVSWNERNPGFSQRKRRRRRRKKRASGSSVKSIEIAVFVDDELYNNEKDNHDDPVAGIQDIVFTYLNSVMFFFGKNVCFFLN